MLLLCGPLGRVLAAEYVSMREYNREMNKIGLGGVYEAMGVTFLELGSFFDRELRRDENNESEGFLSFFRSELSYMSWQKRVFDAAVLPVIDALSLHNHGLVDRWLLSEKSGILGGVHKACNRPDDVRMWPGE